MRIATWNINSIKQRMDNLAAWLSERRPDLVCLQEIKCVDEAFPREPLEALGYNVAVHGQKTFNGVAVLSKPPLEDVTPRLPGDDGDAHARFLEAVVSTKESAWYGSAGELTALAMIKANRKREAAALLSGIAADTRVPETIRARAEQLASGLAIPAAPAAR